MTDTSPLFPWLLLQRLPGMTPQPLRRLFAADLEADCIRARAVAAVVAHPSARSSELGRRSAGTRLREWQPRA